MACKKVYVSVNSEKSKAGGWKMSHSRRKLDLTGQRFGKLTVLEPAENIDGRTAWRCQCDCGRECVVKTVNLRNDKAKDCGCGKGLPPPPDGKNRSRGARGRASLTYIDGTCVEMLQAKTIRSNNHSGVTGVDWRPTRQQWRASICFKGKRYYLGGYQKFQDAVDARKRAEETLHNPFLAEHGQGT